MQRIQNIKAWQVVEDGKSFNLTGLPHRRVRLDVNSPYEARLWLSDGDGVTYFLASVLGRDVIEFQVDFETCSITAEGGDVYIQTVDGEDLSFSIPDAESFTRLIERRPRNHEMELMNFMMNQNIERRLAAQRDELVALWGRREAAAAAPAPQSSAPSDGGGNTGKSESAGTAGDAGSASGANDDNGSKPEPAKAK